MAVIGWLIFASLFCVQTSAEGTCDSGITFTGKNITEFDGDYLLQKLYPSGDGGFRYGGPQSTTHVRGGDIGRYTISPGCLGLPVDCCNDLDKEKSKGKWVLYHTTTPEQGSYVDPTRCPSNVVVAICASGCPPPVSTGVGGLNTRSVWPGSGSFETTWELTGEQGSPGKFTASLSCCHRKRQACDGYNLCSSHKSPLGIIEPPSCRKDSCCMWQYPADIAVGGKCVEDPSKIETQCDHSRKSPTFVV